MIVTVINESVPHGREQRREIFFPEWRAVGKVAGTSA